MRQDIQPNLQSKKMAKKILQTNKASIWIERIPEGTDQLLYYNLMGNHLPFVTSWEQSWQHPGQEYIGYAVRQGCMISKHGTVWLKALNLLPVDLYVGWSGGGRGNQECIQPGNSKRFRQDDQCPRLQAKLGTTYWKEEFSSTKAIYLLRIYKDFVELPPFSKSSNYFRGCPSLYVYF
jgi:hypothetical protein